MTTQIDQPRRKSLLKPVPQSRPLRAGEINAELTGLAPLTPVPEANITRDSKPVAVDDEVRLWLLEFKTKNQHTNKDLQRILGCSNSTIVSKYLNCPASEGRVPDGDWLRLQGKARELMQAEGVRKAATAPRVASDSSANQFLFSTPASQTIYTVLEIIRRTNDFSLVHGPAGAGKTCGAAMYVAENPRSVLVTAGERKKDGIAIARELMHGVKREKSSSFAEAAEAAFKDSGRLIIVDNAQRLTRGALAYLFDFHDATGCPVALIGNPEVLDKIRGSDQFFSRVGLMEEVTVGGTAEAEQIAGRLLSRIDASLPQTLRAEATQVLLGRGHIRTLEKQLNIMRVLMETPGFAGKPREAFAAAGRKLVKDEGRVR